jgi:hypothetical protein
MKHPYDLCHMHGAPKPKPPAKTVKRKTTPVRFRVDIFQAVNDVASTRITSLCHAWLPGGRMQGTEYVVLNPVRNDNCPGSFRINTATGKWADFAVPDARGGDMISLRAYLDGTSQIVAARTLAAELGVDA